MPGASPAIPPGTHSDLRDSRPLVASSLSQEEWGRRRDTNTSSLEVSEAKKFSRRELSASPGSRAAQGKRGPGLTGQQAAFRETHQLNRHKHQPAAKRDVEATAPQCEKGREDEDAGLQVCHPSGSRRPPRDRSMRASMRTHHRGGGSRMGLPCPQPCAASAPEVLTARVVPGGHQPGPGPARRPFMHSSPRAASLLGTIWRRP